MGVLGGSAAASRECKLDITRRGSHSMGLLPSLGTLKLYGGTVFRRRAARRNFVHYL